MQIQIESTQVEVTILHNGAEVPARVWEGYTATGIKVSCLVTRIAVENTENTAQFERELQEHRPPTIMQAFPMRMIL